MVIILNGSYRGEKSNSNYFLTKLEEKLMLPYKHIHLNQIKDFSEFVNQLSQADALVLGMPLYVDSVPAQVMDLMEKLYEEGHEEIRRLKVYVVSNLGFYDSVQIHIQLNIVKNWCQKMGILYGGGLAIGAGEMLGGLGGVPINQGPNRKLGIGLQQLADAVSRGVSIENIYVEPSGFPRWLYKIAADMSWIPKIRKNGISRKEMKKRMI